MLATLGVISAQGATNFITSVDWSKPTWDLFIFLFFVVAAFLYGISLGRDRILVIMVSIYMALTVVNTAPDTIAVKDLFVIRVSAFLGLFLVLFFLLSRSALLRSIAAADNKGNWLQVFVFSILHVGLLISVTLSFLPAEVVKQLSPLTKSIFILPPAPFLWVLAPIIAMVVFTNGKAEEKKYKYEI